MLYRGRFVAHQNGDLIHPFFPAPLSSVAIAVQTIHSFAFDDHCNFLKNESENAPTIVRLLVAMVHPIRQVAHHCQWYSALFVAHNDPIEVAPLDRLQCSLPSIILTCVLFDYSMDVFLTKFIVVSSPFVTGVLYRQSASNFSFLGNQCASFDRGTCVHSDHGARRLPQAKRSLLSCSKELVILLLHSNDGFAGSLRVGCVNSVAITPK